MVGVWHSEKQMKHEAAWVARKEWRRCTVERQEKHTAVEW